MVYDSATGESEQKGKIMKNFVALSICGILAVTSVKADVVELHTNNCDINAMRAELNRAVAEHRAVITKIVCEEPVAEQESVADETCGEPFERVINREYFVRETVQAYRPVVHYEPAETYTTFRAVCDDFGCDK